MRTARLFSVVPALSLLSFLLFCQPALRGQNGRGTNGGAFSFATNRVMVSEKDGSALLPLTRNAEVGKMLVDVISKDGTATNGVDFRFAPVTNTIKFLNLETALSILVPIVDNSKTNATGSVNASFT